MVLMMDSLPFGYAGAIALLACRADGASCAAPHRCTSPVKGGDGAVKLAAMDDARDEPRLPAPAEFLTGQWPVEYAQLPGP